MRLLLLQLLVGCLHLLAVVQCDLLHYYKLKKFVKIFALAQALGRRPTILPVPIPIPIPIGQNEVIRIPASSAKNIFTIASPKYSGKRAGSKYTGSSPFGYALPGSFDSNLLGGSNYMMMDGNNMFGGAEFASPSILRVVSGSDRGLFGKSQRYIVRGVGGRTTRDSDYLELMRPPLPVIHHDEKKMTSSKEKKPIPIGEKFRLP